MKYQKLMFTRACILVFFASWITGPIVAAQDSMQPLGPGYPEQANTDTALPRRAQIQKNQDATTSRAPLMVLAGQRLISYLTNLRSAIERDKILKEEEKKKIISSLNEMISSIQTQSATISNTQASDALAERFRALQNFWQEKQNTITYYLGLLTGGNIRRTIERFHAIESKFDLLFGRFEPSSELLDLKKKFSEEVAAAEEASTQARDVFTQIKTPGDHKAEFKEGLQAFRDAHTHLNEARRLSRELIGSIRTILGAKIPYETSTPAVQP